MNKQDHTQISRRRLILDATTLVSGGLLLPGVLTEAAGAQKSSSELQRWTIASDQIERVMSYSPTQGLLTETLRDKVTGVNFVDLGKLGKGSSRRGRTEFSFQCEGQACHGAGADFSLLGVDHGTLPNGTSLNIHLRHKVLPLDVSVVYRVYEGHPAVRKSLEITNTGEAAFRLTHMTIEALALSMGPEYETLLDAQYGTQPREIFYTGRSEDAALLLSNGRTRAGVAVISEVPGYMKRTEIAGWDDKDNVRLLALYDTDLMPFERKVAGGETFTTASVSLVTFRREDAFQDPRWVLPSYTAEVLMRRVNAQGPPWIYNTWEPFRRDVNRDLIMKLIDAASAMGIEIFTIDDGWQKDYGANTVDTASFPGGLEPIQQLLEAKGMRLGLWIPMAALGKTTKDAREHPEWAARDLEGKVKTTGTAAGEKIVMCMASPFRDAAADRINDAIQRFNLAYVKLDLTTIFNAYGEAPGCWAKGHDHGTWAESLNRIYEGIAYVTHKVYARHPDVLLDLTFELWGQKHLIDAGLLAAGDLDWLSNVDDTQPDSAGPIQARQLLYARAASMPAESMLIGNIHAELPSREESFATAIGSAPLLLGDLRKLSEDDRAWYRERIRWFKALRRRVKISQSFFPLGSWQQTSSVRWDGFARLARSGEGVIVVFSNRSAVKSAVVQLPLMPAGNFKVRSVITASDLGTFSQADWMKGVQVLFPSTTTIEVLEVSRTEALRG